MAMNHQTELNEQELNTIAGGRFTEPKPLPMTEPRARSASLQI